MSDLIEQYQVVVGVEAIDQLYQLAKPLKGKKIVHVNSTRSGGGVAEILNKMVPLTQHLGIDTAWEVIEGPPEFYDRTKSFHNALQGDRIIIPPSNLQLFEYVNHANALRLRDQLEAADVVMIHDPQPVALIEHCPNRKGKWIWRCHIDASRPFWPVWKYISKFASQYDASIFSLAEFAHQLPIPMYIIPPSIDPLSEKNIDLEQHEIDGVLAQYNIDSNRPLITQISRFDRFKDPVGVIRAYSMAKKFNPEIQLLLAGGGAADDPEGQAVFDEVKALGETDPDLHILMLPDKADRAVNALQRASAIIIQKSVKEGFGLTVTEGLWKGKPVIGGAVGGIKLQVINGQTGHLVHTPEGAAYWMRYLLQHPEKGAAMGARGKEFVRSKFLSTRQLREYLTLIYSLGFEDGDRIEL